MAKAKTVKEEIKLDAPALKVGGSGYNPQPSESGNIEHITVRGRLATYVMTVNLDGSTFNAYIVDNKGGEYDVDADITTL